MGQKGKRPLRALWGQRNDIYGGSDKLRQTNLQTPECVNECGEERETPTGYIEKHRRIEGVLCVPNPRYGGLWMEKHETLNAAYSQVCELWAHGYCSLAAKGAVLTVEAQRYFIGLYEKMRRDDMPSFASVLEETGGEWQS